MKYNKFISLALFITVFILVSCSKKEKEKEIGLFKIIDPTLTSAIDSFIEKEIREKDDAVNVSISEAANAKIAYISRQKYKEGYFRRSNLPQIITNYKGIPILISIKGYDHIFISDTNVEQNDSNSYIDRLITDGAVFCVYMGKDTSYFVKR